VVEALELLRASLADLGEDAVVEMQVGRAAQDLPNSRIILPCTEDQLLGLGKDLDQATLDFFAWTKLCVLPLDLLEEPDLQLPGLAAPLLRVRLAFLTRKEVAAPLDEKQERRAARPKQPKLVQALLVAARPDAFDALALFLFEEAFQLPLNALQALRELPEDRHEVEHQFLRQLLLDLPLHAREDLHRCLNLVIEDVLQVLEVQVLPIDRCEEGFLKLDLLSGLLLYRAQFDDLLPAVCAQLLLEGVVELLRARKRNVQLLPRV